MVRAAAGVVAGAVALERTLSAAAPTATEFLCAAVFGVLLAASWVWPVTLHVDGVSDAIEPDEAFFVLLVLVVPAAAFSTMLTASMSAPPDLHIVRGERAG